MSEISNLKKLAAELQKFSVDLSQVQWVDIGSDSASYKTFVKDGSQWYLIEHEEGQVNGGRKVTEEDINIELEDTEDKKIETSNDSFKTFDRSGFFTVGYNDDPVSIADVLAAINSGMAAWLEKYYD